MPLDNYVLDLDESVTGMAVSFTDELAGTIAADLRRPKGFGKSRRHPALIIGAPYGGAKGQGAPASSRRSRRTFTSSRARAVWICTAPRT